MERAGISDVSMIDPQLTIGGGIASDPLIEEARDRQRRRRRRWLLVLLLGVAVAAIAYGGFQFGRGGGGASSRIAASAARPAGLPRQPGWYVGQARVFPAGCSQCVQTGSWASTIPYLDRNGDFPQRTIPALGPHDVIVWVTRSWQPSAPKWMLARGSLRVLPGRIHANFEGNPTNGRVSEWFASTWRGGSFDSAYVFFGSPHPSRADVERAERELAKATFPQWSRP